MTRFAVVAPTNILSHLAEENKLGSTHLLLAHDVVKWPNEYKGIFAHADPAYDMIIMDNSVIELGGAVDLPMIREACRIVPPSFVVLPDVLLDGQATVAACSEALFSWDLGYKFPYMYVPQGKTIQEFVAAAEPFAAQKSIGAWGIPRNLVKSLGTRRRA